MDRLSLIRVSRITSNDDAPMVYLPKEAREKTGINKGDLVMVYVDSKGRIILEKFHLGENAEQKSTRRLG